MSSLLSTATVTPVAVGDRSYELLAWGSPDARRGWLCLTPQDVRLDGIRPSHQHLMSVCGGIVERFREPESWWNNQNEVLTESAARTPVAPVLNDYSWLWHDQNLEVPIRAEDYYVVGIEANGNLTLVRRHDGHLVVFAPDHAFEGVTALAGCPPYSLMTIDAAPDLEAWIELCADAWSD